MANNLEVAKNSSDCSSTDDIWGLKFEIELTPGTYTFSFFSVSPPKETQDGYWYAKAGTNCTQGDELWVPSCDEDNYIAVELSSFSAMVGDNQVLLSWKTQSETENLGFHVCQTMSLEGIYARINSKLIPGAGTSDETHRYSFVDHQVELGNTYYYKLADVDFNGNMTFHGPISVTVTLKPTKYVLEQCYPNPFNPETAINFSIKEAGKVSLKIYNLQGKLIRSLIYEDKLAGSYSVIWNGTDDQSSRVSSGTYLYTLKVNGFEATKKLVFMK